MLLCNGLSKITLVDNFDPILGCKQKCSLVLNKSEELIQKPRCTMYCLIDQEMSPDSQVEFDPNKPSLEYSALLPFFLNKISHFRGLIQSMVT